MQEKKLTIGIPSYNNFEQVWWTIQSLRFYHDLSDCEILVIDNYGDIKLEEFCKNWASDIVKYIKFTEQRGTAIAKEQVFKNASGRFVLCIDSHVLLAPDTIKKLKEWIDKNPNCPDLIHGAMVYDNFNNFVDRMLPVWRGGMFGIWGNPIQNLPKESYEIEMHGGGLIGSFKDQWLGYNKEFVGFGGEEGYIHEKYKQAGRKIMCLPFLVWLHKFNSHVNSTPYVNILEERIRNYLIGWSELGLDISSIKEHFNNFIIDFRKEIDENKNVRQFIKILRK
jgi:glycosyltransferase involved in cell wall biosynthesis